jgi:hypothetical protein
MSYTKESPSKARVLEDYESTISRALKKVGARKENDLCKYIPMSTGGYMHHFTLKKLKRKDPKELAHLIDQFILTPNSPNSIPPKQRAPRGSRKKSELSGLTKTQLEQMIALAKNANAKDLLAILAPKKSLNFVKKELIRSIKKEIVDEALWLNYIEAVNSK